MKKDIKKEGRQEKRQEFRDKEIRQEIRQEKGIGKKKGMKFIGNRKEKKKSLNPKSLNLKPVFILFLVLILLLEPLILNPAFNPVFASPSTGYEKPELEKIFEGKDTQGRMYSEYLDWELNRENDYHTNILYGTVYNKQKNLPMKEEYLPVASFKVEVYRNGKWELVGNTSSDTVKHLGTFKVGDKLRITDTSKANKGTLDTAHFSGAIRIPGYKFNEPNGFGGDLKPGGSKIVTLETRGNNMIALQTSIKETAYNTKDKIEYPIWSTNGAKHTWGKGMFGKDKNVPWEGWSHFTAVTFDVEKEGQSNIIMRELELIDPETGKVLESFYRDVDNLDPMNVYKQKTIKTNTNPYNASELKKDKVYKVRAKYQFVSFKEGEFDISKPEKMTNKQRNITTKVNPSKLDVKYAFDNNATKEGTFDITEVKTYNKELKNLETATFEWNFKVPEMTKKYIKIAGMVPDEFAKKGADEIEKDNWSAVFAKLASNDIGMNKNVRLINEENKVVTSYKKGEYFRLIFPVEHVEGKEIVGTNETKNPKVYINIEVKDENGKVIFTQSKLQARTELHPKTVIDMPISEKFRTNSNKITVCATIDPIHKTLGYNDDPRNDKICVTYEAGLVDIGIQPPVKVLGSKDNIYIEPNKPYRAQAQVKHFAGNEAIGTNETKNPKVKVKYTVFDARGVKIHEETVQTNKVLQPGETIIMPPSSSFETWTGMAKVCAEIDPIHRELGYNFNRSNDGPVCQPVGMKKNYAVKDVKVNPQFVHFKKGESSVDKNVNISFTISNESIAEQKLSSTPRVVVKYRGDIIWQGTVGVRPGESVETSISKKLRVYPGDNIISVEVNPIPRAEVEFIPGVSNPYFDNVKTNAIRAKEYEACQQCMKDKVRTYNKWGERWDFREQWGSLYKSSYIRCGEDDHWTTKRVTDEYHCGCKKWSKPYKDEWGHWNQDCLRAYTCNIQVCEPPRRKINVKYESCAVEGSNHANKDVKNYEETYRIEKVEFGSKLNKDTGNEFRNVKDGGYGKIKAGYGFELKVTTKYDTNRYIEEPFPSYFRFRNKTPDWQDPKSYYRGDYDPKHYANYSDGYCNWNQRRPITKSVHSPDKLYMEMPYTGGTGKAVCYILTPSSTIGPWYSETRIFELPERNSFGKTMERKIYINQDAKPNNKGDRTLHEVKIVTPRPDDVADRFFGYDPDWYQIPINAGKNEKKAGVYLHDCTHFYIVIYPQDDIKSHIIQ